jgi:hypothetical protein
VTFETLTFETLTFDTFKLSSVLGALAILGAAFNGVSFLNYGHAFSSMIMAGLWALALACYFTGLYLAARRISRS